MTKEMTKEDAKEIVTQALALALTAPSEKMVQECSMLAATLAVDAKLNHEDIEECKANAVAKVDALREEHKNRVLH